MRKEFKSLGYPEQHGYIYDGDSYQSYAPIDQRFRMFAWYGFEENLRSNEWALDIAHAGDYLHSLAMAALGDDELAMAIRWRFDPVAQPETIAFAAEKIRYSPEVDGAKRRYFSLSLKKIGNNHNLQYDKRYQSLESYHDGSAKMVHSLLSPEHPSGLERFILADQIREYMNAKYGYGEMEHPSVFLGWSEREDHEGVRLSADVRNGIELCRAAIAVAVNREHVRGSCDCYLHNLGNRRVEAEAEQKLLEAPTGD